MSINVDLRAGTGGPETAPNASPDATRQKVAWVKEAAGNRFDDIELNCLIGFAMITDDAQKIADAMAPTFGIDPADALHVPVALIGTLDEMVEELQWRREEYGISYFSIEADCWESLAPVVSRLADLTRDADTPVTVGSRSSWRNAVLARQPNPSRVAVSVTLMFFRPWPLAMKHPDNSGGVNVVPL